VRVPLLSKCGNVSGVMREKALASVMCCTRRATTCTAAIRKSSPHTPFVSLLRFLASVETHRDKPDRLSRRREHSRNDLCHFAIESRTLQLGGSRVEGSARRTWEAEKGTLTLGLGSPALQRQGSNSGSVRPRRRYTTSKSSRPVFGRDARYRAPTAQIRACPIQALDSPLGWGTSKR
jgi:hypothetical protein